MPNLERKEFVAVIEAELRQYGYCDHPTDSDLLRAYADELLNEYLFMEEIEFHDEEFGWSASEAKTIAWEMELSVD